MPVFPFNGSFKGIRSPRPRKSLPALVRQVRNTADPEGPRTMGPGHGNGPGFPQPSRLPFYAKPGPLMQRSTRGSPSFSKAELKAGYRKVK